MSRAPVPGAGSHGAGAGSRRVLPRSAVAAFFALAVAACSVPTPTPTPTDSAGPGPTGTPTQTAGPSPTPTATPTATPVPVPTGEAPTAQPTATPGQDDTDGDGGASLAPFYADTQPDRNAGTAGAQLLLTDIRVGSHDGFDRVVFEYSGTGEPGWNIRYVGETVGDPSGLPVRVQGGAWLEATITGQRYPEEGESFYSGPRRVAIPQTEVLTEVVFSSLFEGIQQSFVGVTEQKPFRAYLLTGPTRVVVEIRHD